MFNYKKNNGSTQCDSPYIIAEISANHNGSIERALKMIELAKECGADAIKIQTYTADTMTIDCDSNDFVIKDGLWKGYKLYDLYKEASTPWEWHEAIFEEGKRLGIDVFSTPFDETAVDFLEKLNNPIYKIASFEITHLSLIEYVARLGKPMIMSTGMASFEEISEAVYVASDNGCNDLTILHCVSEYPAPISHCNLAMIADLRHQFPMCKIGLSDHTLGSTVPIAAVALGASVIEKHFTLSRSDGGVDSAFSMEPSELKQLCGAVKDTWLSIGDINYRRTDAELNNKIFRRSIYAVKKIKQGECFSSENIRIIRPGYGSIPKTLPYILGKKANKSYLKGDRILNREEKDH